MKKILILAVMAMMAVGCASPEKKATKALANYYGQVLKDPSSYELIELGTLDSLISEFEGDKYWMAKFNVEKPMHALGQLLVMEDDERERAIKERDSVEAAFVPEHIGWKATHRYRAKNGFGALDIYEQIVHFDIDLSRVIEAFDIEEEEEY